MKSSVSTPRLCSLAALRPLAKQQRGAALIVALLVVIIVTLLVTSSGNDFLVSFRRTENQLHSQQAYAYLVTAEGIARQVLLLDLDNGDTDSDTELWATESLQYPTEHGVIAGKLYDMSGRINLASLRHQPTEQLRYDFAQLRFIRLLQVLELDPQLDPGAAEELANAVFDWVDTDDKQRSPGGAESLYYSSLEPALRAPANGFVASVSELRWVKGMTPAIYRALAPYITVWPDSGGNININTAPLAVLRSLNADKELLPLSQQEAEEIILQRQQRGMLENLDIFTDNTLQTQNINTSGLNFSSEYFLLATETQFLDRRYRLNSVIYRDSAKRSVRVVARSQGSL